MGKPGRLVHAGLICLGLIVAILLAVPYSADFLANGHVRAAISFPFLLLAPVLISMLGFFAGPVNRRKMKECRDEYGKELEKMGNPKDGLDICTAYDGHYRGWRKDAGALEKAVKILGCILWASMMALSIWAESTLALDPGKKTTLIVLTLVVLVFNFVSCYRCWVFAWFLVRISRSDNLRGLRRVHARPVLTPLYRRLSSTARLNCLIFAICAFLYTTMLASGSAFYPSGQDWDAIWGMISDWNLSFILDEPYVVYVCWFTVFVLGLANCITILLLSYMSLGRILRTWRDDSAGRFVTLVDSPSRWQADMLASIYSGGPFDGRDAATIIIGVATMCINAIAIIQK